MKKFISIIFCILFVSVSLPISSFANDNNIGFTIQPELPKNQKDKKVSYFDLRMKPKQQQTIYVRILNTSNKDGTFRFRVNQAYTNKSGFIDYAEDITKKDESLRYDTKNIISYKSQVRVKAKSVKKVPIKIKMPAEKYDGQILAGIQVMKEDDSNSKKESIKNQYGYILGLRLTETDESVKREIKLVDVKPAVSFARTSVVAKLQNPTMDAIGHLKYKAVVTDRETNRVVKKVSYDKDMQMAPNSTYDFAIDWDKKPLEAGDYRIDLTVSDAKNNKWNMKENFTITENQAEQVNKVAIGKVPEKTDWTKWIIIGGVILLIIVILLVIWYRKKNSPHQVRK